MHCANSSIRSSHHRLTTLTRARRRSLTLPHRAPKQPFYMPVNIAQRG